MIVVERKPVPLYEVTCSECKSRIRYRASEVSLCSISCPVCNTTVWADTRDPVAYEKEEDHELA